MTKKHTYELVKQKFLEGGCVLLENTYKNSSTLMRYICRCGEESSIAYNTFRQGRRCSGCGGTKKYTCELVKQKFLEGGCVLLETSYENDHTPMKYICSCGEESSIAYDAFRQGRRCSGCSGKP